MLIGYHLLREIENFIQKSSEIILNLHNILLRAFFDS